ncbi:MAG: hypothetical protein MI922_05950, partial [Bacteroidales bacterium]|nr:hypothetical protein [Bacteroidales bacterium]
MKHLYSLIIILLVCVNLPAQNVKRSFKSLEKKEYQKAKEMFLKNVAENKESVAANFGMALVLADDQSPYFNILDAWAYVEKIQGKTNKLTQDELEIIAEYFLNTEVRRTSRPVKHKIDIALQAMEDRLIKYIREERDLEAVYALLERYPNFKHYDNVIHIRNQFEFRVYEKQNTLKAYQEFIEKFPDAAQVPKAQKQIDKLAFEEIKKTNTLAVYNKYIREHPQSEHLQSAIKLRNAAAFKQAKVAHSVTGYDQFITTYPDALELAEAKKLRRQLLFEEATRIRNLEAYNEFINEYPDGLYFVDIFNMKSEELGKEHWDYSGMSSDWLDWAMSYDKQGQVEHANAFAECSDGSLVIVGTTQEQDNEYSNIWMIKTNSNGTMLWNITAGQPYNDEVLDVYITSNDDIICVGYTQINEEDSLPKGWMFKVNSEGKKIWSKNLGNIEILATDMDAKDRIYMSFIDREVSDTIDRNYTLNSYNKEGVKAWERSFVLKGDINDIDITYEGNILVTGTKWLSYLDNKKYVVWDKLFEDKPYSLLFSELDNSKQPLTVVEDSSNFYFIGFTNSGVQRWGTGVPKSDSLHVMKKMCINQLGEGIVIEEDLNRNIIRKVSSQGNLYPEVNLPNDLKIKSLFRSSTGKLLLLLEKEDIIVF